jgi:hypothetical protein
MDRHVGSGQTYPTIQSAVNAAVAGDNIIVHAGTYNEQVVIAKSGLTIQKYGTDIVKVDCTGYSFTWAGVFQLNPGANNILIDGFEIQNSPFAGIMQAQNSGLSNFLVRNCYIHNCAGPGMKAYNSSNVEFGPYNTVYNVHTGMLSQEAISFSDINGFNIHHNHLEYYGKEGIDCKSGARNGDVHHNRIITTSNTSYDNNLGIYCDAYSSPNQNNIRIYNNYITGDSGCGIAIGAEKDGGVTQNIFVYNNIIDMLLNLYGISITTYNDGVTQNIHDIYIYNNTVRTAGGTPMQVQAHAGNLTGNIHIKNNIFMTQTGVNLHVFNYPYPSLDIFTLLNNLYWKTGGSPSNTWANSTHGWGAPYFTQDPLFTGGAGSDYFRLQNVSPARDQGTDVDLTFDYADLLRPVPVGGAYDIGAYEYREGCVCTDCDDCVSFTIAVI